MNGVNTKNGELYLDNISLSDLANKYGTPSYVYSASLIKKNFLEYKDALRASDKVCFAVKSNSNINLLKLLNSLGSGFDVVSGNELKRCLLAGADPKDIVFSGVGKTKEEIQLAIEKNIFSINIESESELERIVQVSQKAAQPVNCAIRVNPNISSESHPYISTGLKSSKFGVTSEVALKMSKRIQGIENVNLTGIACHIGSQITKPELILESLEHLVNLAEEINRDKKIVSFLDIGGGLGITYKNEESADTKEIMNKVLERIKNLDFNLVTEPGRSIVGNAGLLLSEVEYIKETETTNFAIIDAGMNDLMRPSLYSAWHKVSAVKKIEVPEKKYEIVGPVCESADSLAKDRALKIEEGSLVVIHDVGAYGNVMTSNYNTRLRPPEILVDESSVEVIKRRESFEELISLERISDEN